MDPSETGAILLLGIDGLVYVGHGRSDERAMFSAIMAAQASNQYELDAKPARVNSSSNPII